MANYSSSLIRTVFFITLGIIFCVSISPAQSVMFPFPQHTSYMGSAILPSNVSQEVLDDSVEAFYDVWKSRYLIAGCDAGQYYVAFNYEGTANPPNAICVSEGQGYGMLITAYMAGHDPNAKTFFDGLYRYYRAHPSSVNNRLMGWRQRTGCVSEADDSSSATDGDLDIAYALLLADKQWGSSGDINYKEEAVLIIDAIMNDDINYNLFSVKLGDWSTEDEPAYFNGTRSSDFMMNHFKVFAEVTGDTNWNRVSNNCYSYINTIQTNNSPTTGLIPDFIKNLTTTPVPATANYLEGAHDGHFYYNACRDPWRIGIDYLMSGDSRALTALNKINTWLKISASNNVDHVYPGYQLNGTPIHSDFQSMAFVAPFAVGAMSNSVNQPWLNNLWQKIVTTGINDEGYYENSIKMLCMIALSGNWWQPQQQRTISFSGYTWYVKSGDSPVGPGPNYFSESSSNVWVDAQGRLHTKITKRDGRWYCSEVILDQPLGYGKYVFEIAGSAVSTMNENAVLGLFTYDDTAAASNYREIDVEYSRWGYADDPTNAQFVVQPYDTPGNLIRWTSPQSAESTSCWFDWYPDSIRFKSVKGTRLFPPYDSVISTSVNTGSDIPEPGLETVHINLWLSQGNAPSDSQDIEIIISKFTFNPIPATPVLISPDNVAQISSFPVQMKWSYGGEGVSYRLQMARGIDFSSTMALDTLVTDSVCLFTPALYNIPYYWRVRGQNAGGNSDWAATHTFTCISPNKWSIVSLPQRVSDPRKITVYPTALSSAYLFDTEHGYMNADSLKNGLGYWIKFGADQTANVSGETILADTLEVKAGWNLIGSITNPVAVGSIVQIPSSIISSAIFGYDAGYSSVETLLPGKGYWIKVTQDGVIILQ